MVKRNPATALAGGLLAVALAALAPLPAQAQSYPDRAVRIIVPTAPGGSIDTTARVVAGKLAELWGKPVVIENRPGAAMIIGADAAAKSAPDGYTLLVAHDGTMAMNPVVYPHLVYHSQRDFEPVAMLASIPEVLLVNETVPAKSIKELIALAKANPGKIETDIKQALAMPDVKAKLEALRMEIRSGASEEMRAILAGDMAKWGRMEKEKNIQIAQ